MLGDIVERGQSRQQGNGGGYGGQQRQGGFERR